MFNKSFFGITTVVVAVGQFLPQYIRRQINAITFLLNISNASVDNPELVVKICLHTNPTRFRQRALLDLLFAVGNYRRKSFSFAAQSLSGNLD